MGAVQRLARAVENQTAYLFNYTQEALRPGDVVGFDSKGVMHKIGTIIDWLPPADHARAQASLGAPPTAYKESKAVSQGFQVKVSAGVDASGSAPAPAGGPPASGKITGSVDFGIGGGSFLDVSADAQVHTLGNDRLWLLRQAEQLVPTTHILIEEAVTSAFVAAATSGWSSSLRLAIDGTVDPATVGLGALGDLKGAGHLDVSVSSGKFFLWQPSTGTPLFRGLRVRDIIDLTGSGPNAFDNVHPATSLDELTNIAGAAKKRNLERVTSDDLLAFYALDDD